MIYTRYGTPIVAFTSAIDKDGYVDLICDLGLNGLKEKTGIHISDLKADGGIEEIYALSDEWIKKYYQPKSKFFAVRKSIGPYWKEQSVFNSAKECYEYYRKHRDSGFWDRVYLAIIK